MFMRLVMQASTVFNPDGKPEPLRLILRNAVINKQTVMWVQTPAKYSVNLNEHLKE